MEKYYLGLDMGTNSIGWAVTDDKYNLIKKKRRELWGVHEFDEAKTAVERRTHRTARRRRQREQVRIGLLKEYFDDEINKVDPNFYARLQNSKYHIEDKDESVRSTNGIFDDKNYGDKEYYAEYPTIFHLRKELIENPAPHDVRLVFLAILNIYKHRGHFLNAGMTSNETGSIGDELKHLYELLDTQLEINLHCDNAESVKEVLGDRGLSRTKKSEELVKLYGLDKKQKKEIAIIKTICGLKENVNTLFDLEIEEKIEIEFSSFGYEDNEGKIQIAIGDDLFEIVLAMKNIYNIGALASVMGDNKYLSEARIRDFEKHKKDLAILKNAVRKYAPDKYDYLFRTAAAEGSYSAYVNSLSYTKAYSSGENSKIRRCYRRYHKERNREDFYKKVKDFYKKVKDILKDVKDCDDVNYILNEIELETFMPKQLTAGNGIIPYQVHAKELKKILENAEAYLPFLKEIDESNLTVSERIMQLFAFRIPYFVGPATEKSHEFGGNGWVVRKQSGDILPWNIEEKIDMKSTQEKFISNLVRRCTYINGENVLPKTSLIYEKFCLLNEINTIKIENVRIPVELKQEIYKDLFLKGKKVTRKKIQDYLIGRGLIASGEQISGIDISINNSLSSYGKLNAVLGEEIDTDSGKEKAENIIFWCTVYGESKDILKEKIHEEYPEITDANIKRILGMKFKDWGRLSREFLELQGVHKGTGEKMSIIQALWQTQNNLMELLYSDEFTFKEELEAKQKKRLASLTDFSYEDLDGFYFSAPVKRMIWRTMEIIKEISFIMGGAPEKIFLEMTRGEEKNDKGRKKSRKQDLLDLYSNVKDEMPEWKELVEREDASGRLKSKKMYLYLTQLGKDIYTGKPINLDELFNDNIYDVDHIYPRHFVKDDSIHNNLVLTNKAINSHKKDNYPIESGIQENSQVKALWKSLKIKGLINEEKYNRLTAKNGFTDEQRADFIARQLVETGQGTKGVADILKQVMPKTEIVYSKASNVSDFRNNNGLHKSRSINDFHHATDAYLNIVVGNVYNTKFTKNPRNFIKNEFNAGAYYNLNRMFEFNVERNGYTAWETAKEGNVGTIATVKRTLAKNTPIITRKSFVAHGGIANQTLYSHYKAKENVYIPIKSSDRKLDNVTKYGGFSSVSIAYFFLVEHEEKRKRIRTIESLPIMVADRVEKDPKELDNYCEKVLNLKEFDIRVRKIGMQSLIKLNGYYAHITGKTGNQLSLRNAVNLCLNQEWMNYLKKIENYQESKTLSGNITPGKNIELYKILMSKFEKGIFDKRPNNPLETLKRGYEKFEKLSIEEQCKTILEILKLTALGTMTADLRLIGGDKTAAKLRMNKKISGNKEVNLITQSITGVFEKEIDLLKI